MYLEVIEGSSAAICLPCMTQSQKSVLPDHPLAVTALQALTLSISSLVCICRLLEIFYETLGRGGGGGGGVEQMQRRGNFLPLRLHLLILSFQL